MLSEEEGVKAIIALQKMVGITEPEDVARRNWNKFSEHEKRNTEAAYNALIASKNN